MNIGLYVHKGWHIVDYFMMEVLLKLLLYEAAFHSCSMALHVVLFYTHIIVLEALHGATIPEIHCIIC